jgi:hypothetical protein
VISSWNKTQCYLVWCLNYISKIFVNPLTYGKFLALSYLAEVKEDHTRVESFQKLFTEKVHFSRVEMKVGGLGVANGSVEGLGSIQGEPGLV